MARATFYRQKRRDGGVRMGLDVDGITYLHHFKKGSREDDPALVYWIDIRIDGARLALEPERLRDWLLQQREHFQKGLKEFGKLIEAGVDFSTSPLLWDMPGPPRGAQVTFACSAVRRLEGRALAAEILDLAEHWSERLQSLSPAEQLAR